MCLGCSASLEDKSTEPLRYDDRLTFWLEFVATEDLARHMAFAGEHTLNVNVAVIEGTHNQAFLKTACREAERNGVALIVWPLLTREKGYWPNQGNAEDFAAYVDELRVWIREDCPRLDGIAIDLEMPITRAEELEVLFGQENSTQALIDFLVQGIDEMRFAAARAVFSELVERIHDDGLRAIASTLPMLLDDAADGDEAIAKALWTPILGIPWDHITFQVYRSIFDTRFAAGLQDPTSTFTSGLVASYGASVVEQFGEQGGIDLGSTGTGIGLELGLANAAELQSDIAAALEVGIPVKRIQIYSLEGLDGKSDAADWVVTPEARAAQEDTATQEIRSLFRAMDLLAR